MPNFNCLTTAANERSIGKDRNLLQWNLLSTGTPQLSYSYNNSSPYASISFSPFGDFFLANENDSVVVYKVSRFVGTATRHF